jgi:hypothetical protein
MEHAKRTNGILLWHAANDMLGTGALNNLSPASPVL